MVTRTGIARCEHSREAQGYPSDMTDAEWALTAPFVPPARRGGRPRTTGMHEVLNAMLYAQRKIEALILVRSTRRVTIDHDRLLYKQSNCIERMFGHA